MSTLVPPLVAPALRKRSSPRLRCVWCHDRVAGRAATCPVCGILGHPECVLTLVRCPTLACPGVLVRPARPPIASRVFVLLGLGLLLSPVALVAFALLVGVRDRAANRVEHPVPVWMRGQPSFAEEAFSVSSRGWQYTVLSDRRTVVALDPKGAVRWVFDAVQLFDPSGSYLIDDPSQLRADWDRVYVRIGHGCIGLDAQTGRVVYSASD